MIFKKKAKIIFSIQLFLAVFLFAQYAHAEGKIISSDSIINFEQYGLSNIGIAWGIAILFFITYFCLIFLYFIPKYFRLKQAIITEYEPPESMRPSEVASLYKFFGITTRRMLTADILYLASLGYIKIKNTELAPQERKEKLFQSIVYFILLFRSWAMFLIVAGIGARFIPGIGWVVIIGIVVFDRVRIKNFIHLILHPKEFSITRTMDKDISSMPPKLVPLYNLISKDNEILTLDTIKKNQQFYEFQAYVNEIVESTKGHKKMHKSFFKFGPFLFLQLSIIFLAGYFFKIQIGPLESTDKFLLFGVFSAGMAVYQLMQSLIRRLLFKMRTEGYRLAGFYRYVLVAEKSRALVDDNPTEKFSKFLPYAVAFGFEDNWIKSFRYTISAPPDWYQGSNFDSISASIMEIDLIMNALKK